MSPFGRKPGIRSRNRARPVPLVAVGLLSVLVVLAGCGSRARGSSGSGGPPTAQQIYTSASHSAMKDAKLALSGSLTSSSSGVDIAITMSGDGNVVFKPAAAGHLTMNMNMTSQAFSGAITLDMIEVGGKSYTKTQINIPGLPSSPSDKYSVSTDSSFQSIVAPTLNNLKVAGEDTIRGDKCWHLTGTYTTSAEGTPTASGTSGANSAHVDEWIRESDSYYVRVKVDTLPGLSLPFGDTSGSTSATPTTASANAGLTIDFSDYDKGVTISAPPADQIGS